jgi:TetR/AcrR family transcriptional regulator
MQKRGIMYTGHSPRVETILESARKQFARYGFSKTTMEEIAAEAGRGKASLYYYFPTKEALFREVVAREQADFKRFAHSTIHGSGTAADKIRAYVGHRLEYFRQLLNLGKLSVQSLGSIRPVLADLLDEFSRWEHDVIRSLLQTGLERGEFSLEDPDRAASTLLHALHGLRLRALNAIGDTQLEPNAYDVLLRDTHLLMDLLFRGVLVRHQTDPHRSHHSHNR